MTPDLKRDLRLLKLRGAFDPKRFYKTNDTSKLPTHFAVSKRENSVPFPALSAWQLFAPWRTLSHSGFHWLPPSAKHRV